MKSIFEMATMEYHIPASGTGLPTMTEGEVEKWGQKDYPQEAMAVFPPDKPMGWPAKEYERDTLNYMDEHGHTVNVITTTGGISTTEYNELNEVKRTLSADDRAIAIKEAKPAEAAEKLSTENVYSGGQLVETLGPEHKIKLAVGKEGKHNEEVNAREQTKYYYDEGAPGGKSYGLVTRTVDDALVGTKEEEPRTTRTYYSGQNGLGWELRKPTSVVTDPAGLDLVDTTVYDKTTGNVVETRSPGGTAEAVYPMSFSMDFGSEGSGAGQFDHPERVAIDGSGNVWVDDKHNGRIEKFSSTGTFLASYGSKGSGSLQFSEAWGLAINETSGNVYVSDTGNNRIEELNSKGEYVRSFGTLGSGNGQLDAPGGLTVDAKGNVWVTDEVNNRVEEFSETGVYESKFGTAGSGAGQFNEPVDIAISEGQLYVADAGDGRIEEFSTAGVYLGQFGSAGSGPGEFNYPYGIVANQTSGDLYITEDGDSRVQEFSPAGKFLTQWETWSKSHELSGPAGLAVNSTGELYIADKDADKISVWLLPEAGGAQLSYASQFGTKGSGESQFWAPYSASIDGTGDLWVTDNDNNRLDKYSPSGKIIANYGTLGTGNGQFKGPTGIAVNQSTGNVYVCDGENNRMQELSSSGTFIRTFGTSGSGELEDPTGATIDASGNVWVADHGHNRIVEFSSTGTYIAAYGRAGTGNGQFEGPGDLTYSAGNLYVTDVGNDRIEEFSTSGSYIRGFGREGSNSGEFYGAFGIAADAAGNLYAVDKGNGRVEEFSSTGGFLASFASNGTGEGQLEEPTGLAISAAGDMFIVDTVNSRVAHWMPTDQAAHDTKTAYYTPEEEATIETCRNHPEWANLPCQTEPGAQPNQAGSPELPVDDVTYNLLDEALTTTEKFGTGGSAVTRTKTETYDSAGRALTSEETSTAGGTLPKTTNKYNKETGALEEQEAEETPGHVKTIKSVYNTLGQLSSYTDADSNTTNYSYEIDGRIEEVSDTKGKQNYAYDSKTGLMTKLLDTIGTFEATYDLEGKILTETYPDKLVAKYTYNPLGAATGIEYEKKTHCEKTCPEIWFSDTTASSIHGEMLTQASTLSNENYSYDAAGRLTETQEIASKTCKTRQYAYDEEGNRLSQTNRESGTETCPTEGGTVERHTYDSANHLMDSGITYDKYGNTTELPATDAGGHTLTSTFYLDNQVATQTQNSQTIEYAYDPAGRTRETVNKGTSTITHYAGPGEAISWLDEGSGKWTRNVPGPDGALDAIQSSTGTTLLQLHDLRGNIVGQAGISESETKLQASFNNTEFGVPPGGKTSAKYAWLGATGVKTEFETGIATESGASYVPQIGRRIQTASVVPPGAFPNGSGPGTPEETVIPGWITSINEKESAATLAEWAAIQEAEVRKEIADAADPAPWVYYFNFAQAYDSVYNIREWEREGKESSIAALFFDLGGALKEAFFVFIEGDTGEKWNKSLRDQLENCVETLWFWEIWGGGCRVSEATVALVKFCFPTGIESEKCVESAILPEIKQDPVISVCGEWVDKRLGDCFVGEDKKLIPGGSLWPGGSPYP
jgi:YD repeat-containing protein